MSVLLVYLLGLVVVAICSGIAFVLDNNGPIDFFEAMGAAFFGIFWPVTVPFFAIAGAVLLVSRLVSGRTS
jgi:uncharacterized membrane protein YphA (DoxX/SURF4 family)